MVAQVGLWVVLRLELLVCFVFISPSVFLFCSFFSFYPLFVSLLSSLACGFFGFVEAFEREKDWMGMVSWYVKIVCRGSLKKNDFLKNLIS